MKDLFTITILAFSIGWIGWDNIQLGREARDLTERIETLEAADTLCTELHMQTMETDRLQSMSMGAIIEVMMKDKENGRTL